MALIFKDNLLAIDAAGLYTLMGFANGTWVDVYTLTGPDTGSVNVSYPNYAIVVDTAIFLPGLTYPFRWSDTNGVHSNIVYITIPQPGYLLQEDGLSYIQQETLDLFYVS